MKWLFRSQQFAIAASQFSRQICLSPILDLVDHILYHPSGIKPEHTDTAGKWKSPNHPVHRFVVLNFVKISNRQFGFACYTKELIFVYGFHLATRTQIRIDQMKQIICKESKGSL